MLIYTVRSKGMSSKWGRRGLWTLDDPGFVASRPSKFGPTSAKGEREWVKRVTAAKRR